MRVPQDGGKYDALFCKFLRLHYLPLVIPFIIAPSERNIVGCIFRLGQV